MMAENENNELITVFDEIIIMNTAIMKKLLKTMISRFWWSVPGGISIVLGVLIVRLDGSLSIHFRPSYFR